MLLAAAAASAQDFSRCLEINEDVERLRCYDSISGRAALANSKPETALTNRWEQHILTDASRERFSIRPYQPNYLLATHLREFNYEPYRPIDPEDRLDDSELKLNISLQAKLADDLFGNNGDLWLAYTQTSYWQVQNLDLSSPFREINHNPELRVAFLSNYRLPGLTLRNLNFGFRHDSNGQITTLSRSWNRVFAEFQLGRGDLIVSLRPWLRVGDIDENPDIEDYYGNFDVRASWETGNQVFSASLLNPFDRRYGVELNWSFPISGRLRGLAQWYYGYGENLIDYNHRNNRISIGVMMSDWL